jgi:phage terminase small subunit
VQDVVVRGLREGLARQEQLAVGVAGRKPSFSATSADPAPFVRTGEIDALPVAPPEELSPDAAKAWDILLPDLISMGVFSPSDAFLLFELCETLASAQGFRREVKTLQARLEDSDERYAKERDAGADPERLERLEAESEHLSGRLKRARAGYLQHMKLVMSIAGEFGISPVARLRLGLMKVQGASLLGALLADDE